MQRVGYRFLSGVDQRYPCAGRIVPIAHPGAPHRVIRRNRGNCNVGHDGPYCLQADCSSAQELRFWPRAVNNGGFDAFHRGCAAQDGRDPPIKVIPRGFPCRSTGAPRPIRRRSSYRAGTGGQKPGGHRVRRNAHGYRSQVRGNCRKQRRTLAQYHCQRSRKECADERPC